MHASDDEVLHRFQPGVLGIGGQRPNERGMRKDGSPIAKPEPRYRNAVLYMVEFEDRNLLEMPSFTISIRFPYVGKGCIYTVNRLDQLSPHGTAHMIAPSAQVAGGSGLRKESWRHDARLSSLK